MSDENDWLHKWYRLHDRFDKIKKRVRKSLPGKHNLQDSGAHRLFGPTLFKPELWSFKAEPLARGLAIGMFVAFTPTLGFQMAISCFILLLIPGNLPIAIAVCWITNPATAAPIYYAEYRVGEWIYSIFGVTPAESFDQGFTVDSMFDAAGALWVGSIVVSAILAVASYFLLFGFIYLERKTRFGKHLHFRRKRPGNRKK